MQLVHLDDPTPGPGEVVIDVRAAGLCHSDVHIIHGSGAAWLSKRPIILGHEVSGTVRELGPNVADLRIGDRVAVALISHPLDELDPTTAPGLGRDGGFAEQAVFPAEMLVQIPDGVSLEQAAVATDSIATAYHAVVSEGEIQGAMQVAIVGLGGLGLNGVRIAALRGATVYGVDIDADTFEGARAQGAAACFTSIADVPAPIDVIVDFAGVGSTTADALKAVRMGGRAVVVGLGVDHTSIDTHDLVTRNIRLQGSLGASRREFTEVLALIADGSLTPLLEEVHFDSVPDAIARLARGDVTGRIFTRPS